MNACKFVCRSCFVIYTIFLLLLYTIILAAMNSPRSRYYYTGKREKNRNAIKHAIFSQSEL